MYYRRCKDGLFGIGDDPDIEHTSLTKNWHKTFLSKLFTYFAYFYGDGNRPVCEVFMDEDDLIHMAREVVARVKG